jgi:hypothetical protein
VFAIELWWEGANDRRIVVLPTGNKSQTTIALFKPRGRLVPMRYPNKVNGKKSALRFNARAMTEDMSSYLAEANHVEQMGSKQHQQSCAQRAKSRRRNFDLEECVIKEVVTFVRGGLDKVGKANDKLLRYPQRKAYFGGSPK